MRSRRQTVRGQGWISASARTAAAGLLVSIATCVGRASGNFMIPTRTSPTATRTRTSGWMIHDTDKLTPSTERGISHDRKTDLFLQRPQARSAGGKGVRREDRQAGSDLRLPPLRPRDVLQGEGAGMKPSIFANIAFQDYISDKLGECPTLSASIAHTLLTQSPRHAWFSHPRLNPAQQPEEAEIADIGSVAHHVLLAGDTRAIVLIDAKDYRTNAAKEARDAARANGGIPLLQHELAAVNDIVIAAKDYLANSEIAGIFDDGAAEQTIVWQEGDAWCRCRPDWLAD